MTFIRRLWGQTTANAGGILDVEIIDFLDGRQKEICADSDILVSGWTANTVATQRQYSVPPEYTSVEAIHLYQTTGGLGKWYLEKRGIDELDPTLPTGTPLIFAKWGLNVSGSNSPAFWLEPIPTAATVSPNDLICYGRQLPQTLAAGGPDPEVRERWQRACCKGALADIYLRLAQSGREYIALADRYAALWDKDKAEAKLQELIDTYKPGLPRDTMGYRLGWG